FTPSLSASPPFKTQVTLDGQAYQLTCLWNFAAQRWYAFLAQQNQSPAWYGPLIGSPLGFNIYLAPNVFSDSTILYRADTGNFEVNP
ncbi:MAG: phage baseplate plug family protein, partial [Thiomonas sp.]